MQIPDYLWDITVYTFCLGNYTMIHHLKQKQPVSLTAPKLVDSCLILPLALLEQEMFDLLGLKMHCKLTGELQKLPISVSIVTALSKWLSRKEQVEGIRGKWVKTFYTLISMSGCRFALLCHLVSS